MIIVIYDFETTGLNTEADNPFQVAAAALDTNSTYPPEILVNCYCYPARMVPPEVEKLTGVDSHTLYRYPHYSLVVPQVYQWAERCAGMRNGEVVIAGYNINSYDNRMLSRIVCNELNMVEISDTDKFSGVFPPVLGKSPPVLDLLEYAHRYWYHKVEKMSLSEIYLAVTGKEPIDAHDALADVLMCLELIKAIASERNLEYVVEAMQIPTPYETMPFGKYKGRPISEVPTSWFQWMNKQNSKVNPLRKDMLATIAAVLKD